MSNCLLSTFGIPPGSRSGLGLVSGTLFGLSYFYERPLALCQCPLGISLYIQKLLTANPMVLPFSGSRNTPGHVQRKPEGPKVNTHQPLMSKEVLDVPGFLTLSCSQSEPQSEEVPAEFELQFPTEANGLMKPFPLAPSLLLQPCFRHHLLNNLYLNSCPSLCFRGDLH